MNLAVFASGAGSNFDAICRSIDDGRLDARIAVCISDRQSSGALVLARSRGIPAEVIPRNPDDDAFARSILTTLRRESADFVALAGYLRKIPAAVVEAYANRLINIHPSLLPSFGGHGMYGRRVHEAVIDYGARVSGATVHLVDNTYDTGPIVMQRCVEVPGDRTPESLAARVLLVEHELYPAALQLFATGRVTVNGRQVSIAAGSEA